MSDKKVDIDSLKADLEMDISSVKELYMVFIDELSEGIKEAMDLLTSGKPGDTGHVIHSIKGISGNYKASEVYEAAQLLDARLKLMDYSGLEKSMSELKIVIDEAILEITEYFGRAE
ncbi:MAG: Hpt domain-containing protein [Clostridiales bacterium]|nr:Hpt domain-containing protein [Clostridiales bacterium]